MSCFQVVSRMLAAWYWRDGNSVKSRELSNQAFDLLLKGTLCMNRCSNILVAATENLTPPSILFLAKIGQTK